MGKCLPVLILALIAMAGNPAWADILTFDEIIPGGPLLSNTSYGGITWSSDPAQQLLVSDDADYLPKSGTKFAYLNTWSNATDDSMTSWQFSGPRAFDGAWFSSNSWIAYSGINQTLTYKLYTNAGDTSPVYTSAPFSLPGGGGSTHWYGSGYTGLVQKVELTSDASVWAMDDLVHTPEPTTLALVGLGLLGAGIRRRRPRVRKAGAA